MKNRQIQYIDKPMVLITQIQRSGGTLLSQLFDHHPQIYAHPHELHIGDPEKWDWPKLNLHDDPKMWLNSLYERRLEQFYNRGYVKPGSNEFAKQESHPYHFEINILAEAFFKCLELRPASSQREILNAYFTAYFAAWSDHIKTGRERFITAFCPRVLMQGDRVERFFQDYPDGYIISSVRDPRSWYVSTRKHNQLHTDIDKAISEWTVSTEVILEWQSKQPERLFMHTYEQAIEQPERVMTSLSEKLGIGFNNTLLSPTYLGRPILPNSSFNVNRYGINTLSLKHKESLNPEEHSYIEQHAVPLYERASQLAAETHKETTHKEHKTA